jgi:hypothetical protein
MNPDKTFTTKLGTTRAGERTRIWIEGNRLIAHGFYCTAQLQRIWSEGKLVLRIIDDVAFAALPVAERGTVSGKDGKPIIDITGARVSQTFGAATHVTVTYRAGRITITRNEV